MPYIRLEPDELSAAARLLEAGSRPRTSASPLPATGRLQLDRAIAAARTAWDSAPSAADGVELAARVRSARDDAARMEDAVLALLGATGESLPA